MVLGLMPAPAVAQIYGLSELYDLSLAVRHGDLRSFDRVSALPPPLQWLILWGGCDASVLCCPFSVLWCSVVHR